MRNNSIWLNGIMGVVVGDALGLPVQFSYREELEEKPVTEMIGHGVFHMPEGSWSDDSSLTLAALSSINELNGIDCQDIMKRFVRWYDHGEYTPFGYAYDIGYTCEMAICRYKETQDHNKCGLDDERSNGNGSLMRIMPACLYVYEKVMRSDMTEEQGVELIHEVSALTHAHLRSKIACGMYYFLVKSVMNHSGTLQERLQAGIDEAMQCYHKDVGNLVQLTYYHRLLHLEEFKQVPRDRIKSGGYVVETMEAALWCLLHTDNLKDCLLLAVNLGYDTDTVAAVAGGLAGLFYGYESIPDEWLEKLQKRFWIKRMCEERIGG
ncbi:MAG: ADP-ribosylglycohydrolase family protein [Bacillota bacterium]|nr:ADP-ribosylglycohydrolase family protein [Bacillota bacterium]